MHVHYQFILLSCFIIPLTGYTQVTADSSATDSLLLQQLTQEMANTPAQTGATTRTGLSFNPDISLIGDFQASYISAGDRNYDLYLNESELSLQSVVDPYARADFFISFGRDPETHAYGVEVEEGYLTTLSLPAHLQLKAGKFKTAVGRINTVHSHALPFIDMPDAFVNLFGEEGLNDDGLSLSWLVPNHVFYQELTVQALQGYSESPAFALNNSNRFTYLAHVKNFWDLSDNLTCELGLTGITGPNDSSYQTNIACADLTFKRKPVRLNTYHSLTWQTEVFYSNRHQDEDLTKNALGLYSFLSSQIAKRWFLTLRYDYAQAPDFPDTIDQSYSLTAGWYATEFQKIEIEAKTTDDGINDRYYRAWLRWIFVMGAHGAHQY